MILEINSHPKVFVNWSMLWLVCRWVYPRQHRSQRSFPLMALCPWFTQAGETNEKDLIPASRTCNLIAEKDACKYIKYSSMWVQQGSLQQVHN